MPPPKRPPTGIKDWLSSDEQDSTDDEGPDFSESPYAPILPGTKNCGLNAHLHTDTTGNLDDACLLHDQRYQTLIDHARDPYWNWNLADTELLDNIADESGVAASLVRLYFGTKYYVGRKYGVTQAKKQLL